MARSNRTIRRKVVNKKPRRSSARAKPTIVASAPPILTHPSATILSGPRRISFPRSVCPNKITEKISSKVANVVGKKAVCGARRVPNARLRLWSRMNPANPIRISEIAILDCFIELEPQITLAPHSVSDLGAVRHFGPFAFLFGVKLSRFLRAEIFNERLALLDIGDDLRILETVADRRGESLYDRRRRFCRSEKAHPDLQVQLGEPFFNCRRYVWKILKTPVGRHRQRPHRARS